ncbi:DUF2188 domain-containing protein [Cupriavidus necator]|uniref:DUF2188 domain-containing protein n=1 Tax=Cupriavidus necator TaxID=106590 RepID=UPI0005A301A8|nr:DUF2188 domain-containing protein [Cupriavidus necator]
MAGDDIHVVPVGDRWTVETQGVGRETFETQDEAIFCGAERARQQQGELLIHSRDGQIREHNWFDNAPRDTEG